MLNFNMRTFCGEFGLKDAGKEVNVMGWVDSLRDHGDVLFIHLRDRSGIVLARMFETDKPPEQIMEESDLKQVSDINKLEALV